MTAEEYISSKNAQQWTWIQQATATEMKTVSNDIMAIVCNTPNTAENYTWRQKLISFSSVLDRWAEQAEREGGTLQ